MDEENPLALIPVVQELLEVGQRWQYRTRAQDSESTLVIVAVDEQAKRVIVNIAIQGLNAGPDLNEILAPIALGSLVANLIRLVDESVDVSEHNQSYEDWKALAEKGEAGAFTTGPSSIVDTIVSRTGS